MDRSRDKRIIKSFGKNLKNIRKSKDLSIRKLAALADLEPSSIDRLEKGEIGPKVVTLIILAEALEIEPIELLIGLSSI